MSGTTATVAHRICPFCEACCGRSHPRVRRRAALYSRIGSFTQDYGTLASWLANEDVHRVASLRHFRVR